MDNIELEKKTENKQREISPSKFWNYLIVKSVENEKTNIKIDES